MTASASLATPPLPPIACHAPNGAPGADWPAAEQADVPVVAEAAGTAVDQHVPLPQLALGDGVGDLRVLQRLGVEAARAARPRRPPRHRDEARAVTSPPGRVERRVLAVRHLLVHPRPRPRHDVAPGDRGERPRVRGALGHLELRCGHVRCRRRGAALPATTPVVIAATASASALAVLVILFQDNVIPPVSFASVRTSSALRRTLVRGRSRNLERLFRNPLRALRSVRAGGGSRPATLASDLVRYSSRESPQGRKAARISGLW